MSAPFIRVHPGGLTDRTNARDFYSEAVKADVRKRMSPDRNSRAWPVVFSEELGYLQRGDPLHKWKKDLAVGAMVVWRLVVGGLSLRHRRKIPEAGVPRDNHGLVCCVCTVAGLGTRLPSVR